MSTGESSVGKVEEIPLNQIEIGKAQVRTDLTSGIDDLCASIETQGLIHPIYVALAANGRYEVLAGQRRFLAHKKLGYDVIRAIVRDAKEVDDDTRVAISLSENMVRKDPNTKELIDACTKLFKRYGSIKMVAQETGLRYDYVSKYVKYDQLVEPLKEMVDDAKLDMKVALQAQKAASTPEGDIDEEAAEKYAQELASISNAQRKNFVKAVRADPTASVEERIERGRKQPVLKQVVVTLEESSLTGLNSYAKDEGVNQDEAAASLIDDGLVRRGILDEG